MQSFETIVTRETRRRVAHTYAHTFSGVRLEPGRLQPTVSRETGTDRRYGLIRYLRTALCALYLSSRASPRGTSLSLAPLSLSSTDSRGSEETAFDYRFSRNGFVNEVQLLFVRINI